MNKQLFPSNQNAAVENKFCQQPLYPYLDFVCKPIAAESKDFALKTGELFYHCIFSLDTLKGVSSQELERKCIQLWADIVDYMREKGLSTDEPEVIHSITLIVYSVARCLLLTDNLRYHIRSGQMQTIIQRYDAVFANQVRKGFNRAEQLIDKQALADWLVQYMESNIKLSDEIERLIEDIEQTEKEVLLLKMQSGFPLLTEQCYKEHKEDVVIVDLRAACRGTATALWKVIRTNEALGYIKASHLDSAKIYTYFTDYFGALPYNERNFRGARNKV